MTIKEGVTPSRNARDELSQFCAYVADDDSRAVIEQVVRDLFIPHALIKSGSIRNAIKDLGRNRSPRILMVDLSESELPLTDINELAEVCEPGVTVMAIGNRNDVGLFRELLHYGICDYLVKPLTPALLQRAMLAGVNGDERSRQTSRLGRLVVTVGTRGGVGATMVATSMAWSIANQRQRRVALLDLDLQFGSVALALDLEPAHNLRDALENSNHIDGAYVDRALVQHSESLYVLSAEERINDEFKIDPESLAMISKEIRKKFHYSVVDFPRSKLNSFGFIFGEAAHVILVTDLSLVGMRDTLRILESIAQLNTTCHIILVANRVGEHRQGEIARAEFEKVVGRKIDLIIAFDREHTATAMNAGIAVAHASRHTRKSIEKLVDAILGVSNSQHRGVLQKIWNWRHG